MRILYVGNSKVSSTGRFYAKGFSDLGHSVQFFDPEFFRIDSEVERLLVRARRGPLLKRVRSANERLQTLIGDGPFDLVFVMGENYFTEETLCFIRQRTRLLYHSHDNIFSDGIRKDRSFLSTLRYYSAVFTTKSQNLANYKALGARAFYVPSCYEPSIHRPLNLPKTLGLTFVGTFAPSRIQYIQELAPMGTEALYVAGNDWQRYGRAPWIHPLSIYENDYAEVLSRARVALGLLREEVGDRHTQRTFEIPACGTVQLTHRNDEILSYFREDKEILCFDSPEELLDKARYLLANDSYREDIARAGFNRVTRGQHTYLDRCILFVKAMKM